MISDNLKTITEKLPSGVKLVAVSKFHPLDAVLEAYAQGQHIFGENRPQELASKAVQAPQDIEWHFIGHLQTNKLKMVLPYASMVQSIDSQHLLDEVDKWGKANGKVIRVLLEMHVGAEQTKQGFHEEEILDILFTVANSNHKRYANIDFCGLMGMATNTDDEQTVRADFARIGDFFDYLRDLFPEIESFKELSIGMSGDWQIALEYGATIVRIGTAIFGERQY